MRLEGLRRVFSRRDVPGTWITDHVFACPYPRKASGLAALAGAGVTLVVNLHRRPHDPDVLAQYGLTEVHLPVRDFSAPSPEQLDSGVAALVQAVAPGRRVAVHCGGGLGRTGTMLACYLVDQGRSADEAITLLRLLRPGSVETMSQLRAVEAFGLRQPTTGDGSDDDHGENQRREINSHSADGHREDRSRITRFRG